MKLNRKNKKGFTIVELVIVIGVIGILSAILIPTFANLTTKAQESAAKEQVSNAYTAYLMEAADNVVDGTYCDKKNDDYKLITVAISQIAQDKVALKLNGVWYTYASEKGWDKKTFASADTPTDEDLVTSCNHNDGYTGVYARSGESSAYIYTETSLKALATFNGVEVYAL